MQLVGWSHYEWPGPCRRPVAGMTALAAIAVGSNSYENINM